MLAESGGPVLHIRTLGVVELSIGGDPPPRQLTWRKNLALLLYLARSPNRQRSREHLVGLLWGDKPESAARHSLNEALRVVRRHAGNGVLDSDTNRILMAEGAVTLDVDLLDQRMAEEMWPEAAELAGGVFLEGFGVPDASGFEDWVASERSHWLRRCVEAHVQNSRSAAAVGDLSRARAAAERAMSLEPLSNAAARAAMEGIALGGDRAAALELYEEFAARLANDLGVDPDAETVRLRDRVRRERTWRLPEALVRRTDTGRRAPLVGRAAELRSAIDVWREAKAGDRAAVLFIEGDPGMGKTRLLEEFVARARLNGATVTGIRAVAADAEMPWSGVLGLARGGLLDAPGVGDAEPSALATFAARLPGWNERFGQETEGVEPSNPGSALRDIGRAVVEEQPLIMFVDDAEWLDADSARTLDAMIRDLEDFPGTAVLTSPRGRLSEHFDEMRSHVGRELDGVAIELGPLAEDDIRELAHDILPEYDDGECSRIARRIAADSAGIPLIAIQLLSAVQQGLELDTEAAGWPLPNRTLDQTLPGDLPDTLVASIRMSFRRLSPEAQQVLATASVLNERVEPALLGRICDLQDDALTEALDELEWERWLAAEGRGYGFLARIVREVVSRDMLVPGQRRRIRAAAEAGTT